METPGTAEELSDGGVRGYDVLAHKYCYQEVIG